MRTLGTELRLRRLIRQHAAAIERLRAEPGSAELAASVEQRLRSLLADVRAAWSSELRGSAATGVDVGLLEGHVSRSLRALEAAIVELARPGIELDWLAERFRATAVPLLLFLRGLEETPAELLGAWSAPALAEIA
jgi:hypothetical protein